jgi:hypothetical protein
MEIRHYEQILGVMVVDDIVEGRFGLLTSHSFDNDFGSDTDLPGFKVPSTAAEAKKARFIVTWPVDNRKYPQYIGYPQYSFSLRAGAWDQTTNLPTTLTLRGTNPAAQESLTIPSGYKALAFKGGIFTVPSGCYIYSASLLTPGANVSVSYAGGTEGKLQYESTFDSDLVIGQVQRFDTSTNRLTVLIDE